MDLKTKHKILDAGNFDCWNYCFATKTISFGDTFARLLNLDFNEISFAEFINRIPEDKQEDTKNEIYAMVSGISDKYIYSTIDNTGKERRFISTTTGRWLDANEGEMISGYILEIQEDKKIIKVDPRSFFPSSLDNQILKKDLDSSIYSILNNVLKELDVDRVAVFLYNEKLQIRECPYEVAKPEYAHKKHRKDVPLNSQKWMVEPTLNGKPFLINDTRFFTADLEQREVFKREGILSILIAPFSYSYQNSIKGCISVDSISKPRRWTLDDFRWFDAVSILISACMQMKDRENMEKTNADQVRAWSDEIRKGVYDGIPVGVEFYNKQGNIIDFNDKDMEIFGFHSKESLLGISTFDNPNFPKEVREAMKRGEDVDVCLNYSFKKIEEFYDSAFDTESKDIIMKGRAVYDNNGEFLYYMVTNSDDTKTDKSIYQYKDFKEMFSLIAAYSKMGYAKFTYPDYKGFFLSQWFKNYEMISHNSFKLSANPIDKIHPSDREEFNSFIDIATNSDKEENYSKDFRVKCSNGSYKWIHTYIISKHNADGLLEVTELNFDISESKLATEKLQESKRQAEAANRLKTAFLANMSHEIRTPLNAIVGFSNILANSDDPEEREQCLSVIENNNAILLKLVTNILDLSKIDAGTMEFRYGEFDIVNLVKEVSDEMRPQAEEKGLSLTMKDMAQECVIHSDQQKISNVLNLLLDNAIKYTDKGSIVVSCCRENSTILIKITDTGRGMSKEEIIPAFERFTKFDERSSGVGLGLSMCKAIIEKLGGNIGATSSLGEGSTFWISLKI